MVSYLKRPTKGQRRRRSRKKRRQAHQQEQSRQLALEYVDRSYLSVTVHTLILAAFFWLLALAWYSAFINFAHAALIFGADVMLSALEFGVYSALAWYSAFINFAHPAWFGLSRPFGAFRGDLI